MNLNLILKMSENHDPDFDFDHEDLQAISIASESVYIGQGTETSCQWTVCEECIYQEFTEYILKIVTDSSLVLSLYTLGVQCRNFPVEIELVSGNSVAFYKINGRDLEPIQSVGGKFAIPECMSPVLASDVSRPASESSICFIEIDGAGRRSCELKIRSYRVNHRRQHAPCKADVGLLSGHDNLPPQPGSGGNN